MQEKRERRRDHSADSKTNGHQNSGRQREEDDTDSESEKESTSASVIPSHKLNQQPTNPNQKHKNYDPNRYKLFFQRDTKEDLQARREAARQPLKTLPEKDLEIDIDEVYKPGSVLDMPKRPPWNYKMSKEVLLAKEASHFMSYLDNIIGKHSKDELSYMELNLETWRQLWRVIEMSDVILLITDVRHPALHFSPTLYDFVTKELKKHLILVLNKVDLVPPALVVAWKYYFQQKFPDIQTVCFTSFPMSREEMDKMSENPEKVLFKRRRRAAAAVGPRDLLKACENIVQGRVNMNSWKDKIEDDWLNDEDSEVSPMEYHTEEGDGSYTEHEQFKDGVLTIGCCGYPNVGKSSLINGLVGKKVVSVSRTPGHTKHFQTIFLTKTVKLCDSPGLVFPSLIPRPMQILAGIYPVAQVREPYTAVGYLAERIPLRTMLRLKHPELEGHAQEERDLPWSAYDVCESYAKLKGFVTARAARPDVYRAANNILRLVVAGRIVMCARPPGYTESRATWETHSETKEIAALQEAHRSHRERDSADEEGSQVDSEEGDVNSREGSDSDDSASGITNNEGTLSSNPFALLPDD